MKLTYEYANRDKTSVLLRFSGVIEDQTICLLVDSGEGVDVDRMLDEDEYLTGILLTHLHVDHYSSIDQNLRDGARIYSSQTNIDILSTVMDELKNSHNSDFNTEAVEAAATPIENETTIGGDLNIKPVPAGHTPGATGFYIEFEHNDEKETILITGDFTRRSVAGYSGLPLKDVDMLFLTGVTSDSFTENLNDSLENVFEHTLSGSPTLVSASSLDGVHFAYLLGHIIEKSDRDSTTISIVGQAAKIYEKLEYDVPNVESHPQYGGADIIYRSEITISGPSLPTTGSSELLFNKIKYDPKATLVQLDDNDREDIGDYNCTIHRHQFNNHPTQDVIDEFAEISSPQNIVIMHQNGERLEEYRDKYNTAVWAPTNNFTTYILYQEGVWKAPPWVNSYPTNIGSNGENITLPEAEADPDFEREPINLGSEGVDTNRLLTSQEEQEGENNEENETKYSTEKTTSSSKTEIGVVSLEGEQSADEVKKNGNRTNTSSAENGDLEEATAEAQENDTPIKPDTDTGDEPNDQKTTSDTETETESESDTNIREELETVKDEVDQLKSQLNKTTVAEVAHTDENTIILDIPNSGDEFDVGEVVRLS